MELWDNNKQCLGGGGLSILFFLLASLDSSFFFTLFILSCFLSLAVAVIIFLLDHHRRNTSYIRIDPLSDELLLCYVAASSEHCIGGTDLIRDRNGSDFEDGIHTPCCAWDQLLPTDVTAPT